MGKYRKSETNDTLKLTKSLEGLAKENKKLSDSLDYITKEELIEAVKKLTREVSKLKGEEINIEFTYDNKKNDMFD